MAHQNSPPETEKRLSSKQMRAALMLANGSTIDATARAVGVNESTVDSWKHKAEFMEAVRQAEEEIYQDALKLLKRTARAGVATLIGLLDTKVSDYVRCNAASKLLDKSIEVHTLDVLEQRMAAMEALLDAHEAAKR